MSTVLLSTTRPLKGPFAQARIAARQPAGRIERLQHRSSPAPRRMTPVSAERGRRERRSSFVVREAAIVAEAATAGGFRTVRVGKRNGARNAAGNGAAALGRIGLRGIDSRRAVAAIGLRIRRLHPDGPGPNAHACDADQRALHHRPSFGQRAREDLFPNYVEQAPTSSPYGKTTRRCAARKERKLERSLEDSHAGATVPWLCLPRRAPRRGPD